MTLQSSVSLLLPYLVLPYQTNLSFPYLTNAKLTFPSHTFLFFFSFFPHRTLIADDSPYPFNREGKFLYKASDWKAVPRSFPGNPPEIALIGRSV